MVGVSIRQERADAFGWFRPFSDDETYGTGFIIQAGASHCWGGSPNWSYTNGRIKIYETSYWAKMA